MFKFHLNFQGCFPPKLKTKLNVTLTLHFGEGIAFLFLANSMKFHLCKLPVATVRFSSGRYAPIFAQPGLASRFPTKLCLGTVRCCQGSICYVKNSWGKRQVFFYANFGGWSLRFKGKPHHPYEDRQSFFCCQMFCLVLDMVGHPLKIILWLIHVWVHQCPPQRYGRDRKIVGVFFSPSLKSSNPSQGADDSSPKSCKSNHQTTFFFSRRNIK